MSSSGSDLLVLLYFYLMNLYLTFASFDLIEVERWGILKLWADRVWYAIDGVVRIVVDLISHLRQCRIAGFIGRFDDTGAWCRWSNRLIWLWLTEPSSPCEANTASKPGPLWTPPACSRTGGIV